MLGRMARADVPRLNECLRLMVKGTDVTAVTCDARLIEASLEAVEALARLQLAAARLGCGLRLRGASDELEALIDLCGLAGLLLGGGSRRGQSRQAEQRE